MFERKEVDVLRQRLNEPRRFIQAITGPRQIGKSTVVRQALVGAQVPVIFEIADGALTNPTEWLERVWRSAREAYDNGPVILAIDEVQKIPQWSEHVKKFWDQDTFEGRDIRVILLGSSTTFIHRGLTESLAGRFERIRMMPWTLSEMERAFSWDLETYLIYGGYPGPADIVHDVDRWTEYVRSSIIEPVISRDVFQMNRIDKPYLLRQLVEVAARMTTREVAYTKLIGTLHDAGNTTTIAHYLSLLEDAGLLCGLSKFSGNVVRQRRSSPKLLAFANAVPTAMGVGWSRSMSDTVRGQCVESAVGTHLRCIVEGSGAQLHWWRQGDDEVDFVLKRGDTIVGIEVKSGNTHHLRGLKAFQAAYPNAKTVVVGQGGMPVADLLRSTIQDLLP